MAQNINVIFSVNLDRAPAVYAGHNESAIAKLLPLRLTAASDEVYVTTSFRETINAD